MNRKWYATPYIVWSVIFIIVPLLMVVYYGFSVKTPDGSEVFSLANFEKFFTPTYLGVFGRSVLYAAIGTVICLLLGYPVAMILSSKNLKHKSTLLFLIVYFFLLNVLI